MAMHRANLVAEMVLTELPKEIGSFAWLNISSNLQAVWKSYPKPPPMHQYCSCYLSQQTTTFHLHSLCISFDWKMVSKGLWCSPLEYIQDGSRSCWEHSAPYLLWIHKPCHHLIFQHHYPCRLCCQNHSCSYYLPCFPTPHLHCVHHLPFYQSPPVHPQPHIHQTHGLND